MMNKGIPIIMNRVGDIADYLTDDLDSILYDGEGAENCVEAIRRVLNMTKDDRNEIKKNAYNCAEEKFNYHLCGSQLDDFFSTLKR